MAGAISVRPATAVTNRYHPVSLGDHTRCRYRDEWMGSCDTLSGGHGPDHPRRRGGRVVLRLPLGLAAPADRLLRLHRLRFKIPPPLVGVPVGVTVGVAVSVGGALGDCPFCTKMVTVEPFAAEPFWGFWLKTVPLATVAGPDPFCTLTWKPALVRIWVAVA